MPKIIFTPAFSARRNMSDRTETAAFALAAMFGGNFASGRVTHSPISSVGSIEPDGT